MKEAPPLWPCTQQSQWSPSPAPPSSTPAGSSASVRWPRCTCRRHRRRPAAEAWTAGWSRRYLYVREFRWWLSVRGLKSLGVSNKLSQSHRCSSCSLQRWSRGSSCLLACWPPSGAVCCRSPSPASCCRSPLCCSFSWSPQTPSWRTRGNTHTHAHAQSFTGTKSQTVPDFQELTLCLKSEERPPIYSPELSIVSRVLHDAPFVRRVDVVPFSGTGIDTRSSTRLQFFIKFYLQPLTSANWPHQDLERVKKV